MSKSRKIIAVIMGAVFAILAVLIWRHSSSFPAEAGNPFKGTIWALVPPLVAIILALFTKEVYSSLFIGIVLGGCFAADFKILAVTDTVVKNGLIEAVNGTSGIFIFLGIIFLVLLAIMFLPNRTSVDSSPANTERSAETSENQPSVSGTAGCFTTVRKYFLYNTTSFFRF